MAQHEKPHWYIYQYFGEKKFNKEISTYLFYRNLKRKIDEFIYSTFIKHIFQLTSYWKRRYLKFFFCINFLFLVIIYLLTTFWKHRDWNTFHKFRFYQSNTTKQCISNIKLEKVDLAITYIPAFQILNEAMKGMKQNMLWFILQPIHFMAIKNL